MLNEDRRDSRMQPWEITILSGQKRKGAKQREGRRESRENNWKTRKGKRVLRKGVASSGKC